MENEIKDNNIKCISKSVDKTYKNKNRNDNKNKNKYRFIYYKNYRQM